MFDQLQGRTYREIAEAWTADPRLIANCTALDDALALDEDDDQDEPAWIGALRAVLNSSAEDRGAVAAQLAAAVTLSPELSDSAARDDLAGPLRDLVRQAAGRPDADYNLSGSSMANTIDRAMAASG